MPCPEVCDFSREDGFPWEKAYPSLRFPVVHLYAGGKKTPCLRPLTLPPFPPLECERFLNLFEEGGCLVSSFASFSSIFVSLQASFDFALLFM
jgi:hypothetical protein